MIDLLRHYANLLAGDPIEAFDLAAEVGTVIADPGIPMPIKIAPHSPKLRAASLARYRDSGLPFLLELEPVAELRPKVATLSAAFGHCRPMPTGRGMPAVCIIDPIGECSGWTIAMVVTLSETDQEDGGRFATSIALRRDPKAPERDVASVTSTDRHAP